jgi:DHA1 family tetracycline resistance protein-like MFS transporter
MVENVDLENAENEEKLDYRKILPVFIIILIDLLGLTIIIPLLPLYAVSFGASPAIIGLVGAAYPVMQFVGSPFLGRLSDRYGRKPILIISQIGTLLGFLVLGLANSLWLLFISRIIDGISGANISTAQAVISDSTTEKTRTQGLGLLGAAFGIGFIIGPVIAFLSLAASGNNYHVPAFVAAGFSLLSILATIFFLKETLPEDQRGKSQKAEISFKSMINALRKPIIGFLLILMFFYQLAFGGFEQLLSLFTLNRLGLDASGNSILFVFVGIIVVMVQGYFIGKWSRKFGDKWLIRMGLIVLAAGLVISGLTPKQTVPWYSKAALEQELSGSRTMPGETPPTQNLNVTLPEDSNPGWLGIIWLMVAMIPAAVGGGVLQPSINSMLTRTVKPGEVGGILGISAAMLSGANSFAPVIGGGIFQALGPSYPFLLGGFLLVILWLLTNHELKEVKV